ncbi:hypothetical protein C7M84_000997 [Penaeus vannamei]|uniref:Uncharacterized protein n=1 Tax=Penaeus vannamei TaxID=6689 RepID=A0A423TUY9_PENVA|nr:hypothetical protein C7M84_000997 [Penaeus vannamei]
MVREDSLVRALSCSGLFSLLCSLLLLSRFSHLSSLLSSFPLSLSLSPCSPSSLLSLFYSGVVVLASFSPLLSLFLPLTLSSLSLSPLTSSSHLSLSAFFTLSLISLSFFLSLSPTLLLFSSHSLSSLFSFFTLFYSSPSLSSLLFFPSLNCSIINTLLSLRLAFSLVARSLSLLFLFQLSLLSLSPSSLSSLVSFLPPSLSVLRLSCCLRFDHTRSRLFLCSSRLLLGSVFFSSRAVLLHFSLFLMLVLLRFHIRVVDVLYVCFLALATLLALSLASWTYAFCRSPAPAVLRWRSTSHLLSSGLCSSWSSLSLFLPLSLVSALLSLDCSLSSRGFSSWCLGFFFLPLDSLWALSSLFASFAVHLRRAGCSGCHLLFHVLALVWLCLWSVCVVGCSVRLSLFCGLSFFSPCFTLVSLSFRLCDCSFSWLLSPLHCSLSLFLLLHFCFSPGFVLGSLSRLSFSLLSLSGGLVVSLSSALRLRALGLLLVSFFLLSIVSCSLSLLSFLARCGGSVSSCSCSCCPLSLSLASR